MRARELFIATLCLLICIDIPQETSAGNAGASVPDEIRSIVGTYRGQWRNFGINENGQVVEIISWTDRLKAEKPVVEGNRAYVTITDEMAFSDPNIPPMTVQGKEGYMLREDGSLGEYFVETYGQMFTMKKLGEDTWAYSVPAFEEQLNYLGFSNVLYARHCMIKVITVSGKIETHRISRVTTVNWKGRQGKEQWIQFVSMKGSHSRVLDD